MSQRLKTVFLVALSALLTLAVFSSFQGITSGITKPLNLGLSRLYIESGQENERQSAVCSNDLRRRHVQAACNVTTGSPHPDPNNPKTYHRLMLDEKHKLIYCVTPKVACTTWKTLLKMATGNPDWENVFVHNLPKMGRVLGLPMMHTLPLQEIKKKLRSKEYLKFVIVRHPFDRLLSSYRNKFHTEYYGRDKYETIIRATRLNLGSSYVYGKSDRPTFEEFVTYLPADRTGLRFSDDHHWRRQVDICHPCLIDYDYILRTETMDKDADPVFQRLAADLAIYNASSVPKLNPTGHTGSVLQLMADLPMRLQKKMFERYKEDFAIYGYSWNPTGEAVCSVNINGEPCC